MLGTARRNLSPCLSPTRPVQQVRCERQAEARRRVAKATGPMAFPPFGYCPCLSMS
jgi:hypothetical protein